MALALMLGVAAAGLLGAPSAARAAPGTVTEFSAGITAGSRPQAIAAGPDGNMWFTENANDRIGRITPSGTVTEFSAGITPNSFPTGIAAGPDGNMWFTERAGRIGRITPTGTITEFSAGVPEGSAPGGITTGPDGNLWFTVSGVASRIGRITTSGTVTMFSSGITPKSTPLKIVSGPDGNLWFTEGDAGVARITPTGTVTEIPICGAPGIYSCGLNGITVGPDGNLWATMNAQIARITSGTVTEFSAGITPGAEPSGIAAGSGGYLWFTEASGDRVARLATDSSSDPGPGPASGPGPGGAVRRTVVLVSGLRSAGPEVLDARTCPGTTGFTFKTLCEDLKKSSRVFVVPTDPRGAGGKALNTGGTVRAGGKWLAAWLSAKKIPSDAVMVGHSMGGLFLRSAISEQGAKAKALVTLGTPHDGSWGADILAGVRLGCSINPSCRGLAAAGAAAANQVFGGAAALADLTAVARAGHRMRPPGIPVYTFAGTAENGGWVAFLPDYLNPHDGIVGRGSAFGAATANLGPHVRLERVLYHSRDLFGWPRSRQPSPGNLLDGAWTRDTLRSIVGASGRLSSRNRSGRASAASVSPAQPSVRAAARVTRLTLRAPRTLSRRAARRARVQTGSLLASAKPFTVLCDGKQADPLPVGDRVFGFPPGMLRCKRLMVTGANASVLVADTPVKVHATVTRVRRGVRITVRGASTLGRVNINVGRRRLASLRVRGRRASGVVPTSRLRTGSALLATVRGRRYASPLPTIR